MRQTTSGFWCVLLFSLCSQRVEFRAEATNALNHTNYGNPNTNITSNNFGRITSAGAGRVMQFALKYTF
jgi:hypothetical protein